MPFKRMILLSLCLMLWSSASLQAQQPQTIVPGNSLVAEGIPAIPASLAQEVDRYTEFRSAALVDWHPTKREMLIRTRFANTPQIHLLEFPGGARTQLTFFSEGVAGVSYQPRTGDSILVSPRM